MAAAITYTLPTMQLVCHLVTLWPSGINHTDSVPATTQSPLEIPVKTLRDDYIAYPEIGFAYKYHGTASTWEKAKQHCELEGAHLAVIDSAKKMEYIGRQRPAKWLLAGIVKSNSSGAWINANTENPIQGIVWRPNQPKSGTCLQFNSSPQGMSTFKCSEPEKFFCEIPITLNATITVN